MHSFERVDAGEHRAPRLVRSREAVRTPRDYALERELVMWMNGGGVGSCAERKQGKKCGLGILTAAGRAGRRVRPHDDLAPSPVNGALDPSQPKDRVVGGGARCEGAKRGAQQLWMLYCDERYMLLLFGVRCHVQHGFAPPSTHRRGGDQPPSSPRRCSRCVDDDALDSEGRADLHGYHHGEGAWGRLHCGGVELMMLGGLMNQQSHTKLDAVVRGVTK